MQKKQVCASRTNGIVLFFSKGKEMKIRAVGESGRGMWCWSGNCVNLTRACPH